MPKVTEEYIHNKKQKIIEAAYQLCLQKTVSTVTMQDIIDATGFSQGGIYRFYRDIDEIFQDMLRDNRQKVNIMTQVDKIFAAPTNSAIKTVLHEVFELLGDFMTRELMGIVKINFELSVLTMNAPLRAEKILKDIEGTGNFEYLLQHTTGYLKQHIIAGNIKLKVSFEELLTYLISSYNGIEMSCIVNHCYKKLPLMEWYTPQTQLKTLETTLYYLLGLED